MTIMAAKPERRRGMNEMNCSIVTDILPLYIDNVVSEETGIFIKEHLSHCEHCRREYEKLSKNVVIADNVFVRLKEAEPLRSFKKQIRRIRVLTISALLILILLLIVPIPVRINHTLDGVFWESDSMQMTAACQVTVDGWYYRYLVKDNIFKGDIYFKTTMGTASYHAPNTVLGRGSIYEDRGGVATVYDPAVNRMRALGYFAVSGNFKEIFIHSEEWNLSAPAGDLGEAAELKEKLTVGDWY